MIYVIIISIVLNLNKVGTAIMHKNPTIQDEEVSADSDTLKISLFAERNA